MKYSGINNLEKPKLQGKLRVIYFASLNVRQGSKYRKLGKGRILADSGFSSRGDWGNSFLCKNPTMNSNKESRERPKK